MLNWPFSLVCFILFYQIGKTVFPIEIQQQDMLDFICQLWESSSYLFDCREKTEPVAVAKTNSTGRREWSTLSIARNASSLIP